MKQRLARVNQLIKKELSQIILREVDFPEGVLATITRVETSANLIESKIYLSAMPASEISDVLGILNRQIYFLQQKLNKRLKMRPLPKITFIREKKTAEAGRIEELLEEIHKEK